MGFLPIKGPLDDNPDSPTDIQSKLNTMFTELYAQIPALGIAEPLKFTVSSGDGRVDTSQVTRLKLSRNLARLALYMNEFGLSFVPSIAFEVTEVLGSAALTRLNNFFQIYYNSPRMLNGSILVPAPIFGILPSFTPQNGQSGITEFTGNTGSASNTYGYRYRWLLTTTANVVLNIGSGLKVIPQQEGSLVWEVTADGPNYSTTYQTAPVTVTLGATPEDEVSDFSIGAFSPATLDEGNSGGTVRSVAVTRTGALPKGASVDYAVTGVGSNPASAADFVGGAFPSGTLLFNPYETVKTISITIAGDTTAEADESFRVTLTNPLTFGTISNATADAVIRNDDGSGPNPVVTLSSAVSHPEGNSGTTAFVWSLTLNRDGSTASFPFSWAVTGNGSNPADASDFGGAFPSGSGMFAPGETLKTITVLAAGDTAVEPDDTFLLTVNTTGANTVTSTGTITNDDAPPVPQPSLALSNAVVQAEGNSGTSAFAYTLTLNRDGSTAAYPFSWAVTGNGSNPADASDFGGTFPSGTGTFAAGETSKTITILVAGDTNFEPDEGFLLTVTASGLNTVTANGTISNDDVAATPTPTLASPAFYDDFEAPTGASSFTSRANWSSMDQQYGGLEVKDGYVHNINEYGPGGSAFIGTTLGNCAVTYGYSLVDGNGNGYEDSRQWFYAWYIDVNNNCRVELSKGVDRIVVRPIVGGQDQGDRHWSRCGLQTNPTGEIKLICRDGKFELMINGKWALQVDNVYSYPIDVIDWTAYLPANNRQGKFGLNIQIFRYPVLTSIKVETLDYVIDSIDEFVGRNSLAASGGDAQIKATLKAGASPTSWVYRLLTPGTLAEVRPWSTMTNVNVTGNTMSGLVYLPVGGPYIVQAGYIDSSDNKARVALSRQTSCGIRIETWGQSNSAFREGPVDGGSAELLVKVPTANTNLTTTQISGAPAGTWVTSGNVYNPGCMYEMARVLSGLLGKPVGIGAQGNSGTGLDHNSPGGGGWSLFVNKYASRRGIVEMIIADQGENDADSASPPTTYSDRFRNNLLPGLRDITGNPDLIVLISPVGRYASTGSGSSSAPYPDLGAVQNDVQREILQNQYLDIVSKETNVLIADFKSGTLHGNNGTDQYHYANTKMGYPEMGRREAYTAAKRFGVNVADGLGARATAAVRSGAVIDISFNLNGGNAITDLQTFNTGNVPSPTLQGMYGYQVSADNFATTLAISSIVRVGNGLRITLAANPGGPVKIRSMYGFSYDDTQLFYTTYADGRAQIPVAPIRPALTAS